TPGDRRGLTESGGYEPDPGDLPDGPFRADGIYRGRIPAIFRQTGGFPADRRFVFIMAGRSGGPFAEKREEKGLLRHVLRCNYFGPFRQTLPAFALAYLCAGHSRSRYRPCAPVQLPCAGQLRLHEPDACPFPYDADGLAVQRVYTGFLS